MNSLCHYAEAITDNCNKLAMKSHGAHNLNINALENTKTLWDKSRTKQNPAQNLRGVNDAIDSNKAASRGNSATIKDQT